MRQTRTWATQAQEGRSSKGGGEPVTMSAERAKSIMAGGGGGGV